MVELEEVCRRAIEHVDARSIGGPIDSNLSVTLNFHPDRHAAGGITIQSMASAGHYQSQFVTGTSAGGLTAHPGGDRWRWESRIFGGAYDDAAPELRPTYGALNFRRRTLGGSVRFGSAHVRLKPEALTRCTFCYPDSVFEPDDFGTATHMALTDLALAGDQDPLDDYVEAQVHGPVRFDRDVEAVVLDPSFVATPVETAAVELGCPIEWHCGLVLDVATLRRHPDYRGQEFVDLGCHIAESGVLTARVIGDASRSGQYDEQALKRVWHCVARFGTPAA